MKHILIALLLIMAGCGGGSSSSDNPPNIAGSYALTNSNPSFCSLFFDTGITVKQTGDNIIIEAIHEGFSDATGTIDNDGNLTATTTNNTQCEGQFVSNSCIITCIFPDTGVCDLTYDKI